MVVDPQSALEQPFVRPSAATLNRLLFPGPAKELAGVRAQFGDVSVLDTRDYLYGLQAGEEHVVELDRGVRLIVALEAVGEVDERGLRTVMCTLNGQLRPIQVRDRSVAVDVAAAEKADPSEKGHVAAPFAGVVTLVAAEDGEVAAGETVATIEAMKMEASITVQQAGTVKRLAIGKVQQVEGGDLLLELE